MRRLARITARAKPRRRQLLPKARASGGTGHCAGPFLFGRNLTSRATIAGHRRDRTSARNLLDAEPIDAEPSAVYARYSGNFAATFHHAWLAGFSPTGGTRPHQHLAHVVVNLTGVSSPHNPPQL